MKIGLNMDIGFIQNHTPVSVIFGINLCYGGIWPLFKSVFRGHFRNTTYTHVLIIKAIFLVRSDAI